MKSKFLFILLFCFLAGCANNNSIQQQNLSYGEFCSWQVQKTYIESLRQLGAKVVFFGDRIIIMIPACKVFKECSSNLTNLSDPLLNTVAEFLDCYQKVSIKIVVNTDILENDKANLDLSKLQANKISKYLWSRGIDSRVIYAIGEGAPKTRNSESSNRRIEITTMKLP